MSSINILSITIPERRKFQNERGITMKTYPEKTRTVMTKKLIFEIKRA